MYILWHGSIELICVDYLTLIIIITIIIFGEFLSEFQVTIQTRIKDSQETLKKNKD
jgi:hypothetical protein